MPTCVIKDGPHVCGEPASSTVGLSVQGKPAVDAPVCDRHLDLLSQTYGNAAASKPDASQEGALSATPPGAESITTPAA